MARARFGSAEPSDLSRDIGRVVRLPRSLYPTTGEAFASFVRRLAWYLELPVCVLLEATGIGYGSYDTLPRAFGITLSETEVASFSVAAGIAVPQVASMLLEAFDGVALDFSFGRGGAGWLRSVAVREWGYFSGSHLCPECLASAGGHAYGAWRLTWKLPWSFACAEHRTLLADECPGCKARPTAGEKPGRTEPAFAGRVLEPAICLATAKGVDRSRGRASPCGYRFTEIQTTKVAGAGRIIRAQMQIDSALRGEPVAVAGEAISSLEFFADLRSLTALILKSASVAALGQVPDFASSAFEQHVRWQKDQKRLAVHTRAPRTAALVAAVVPAALETLDAENPRELGERLLPLVRRAASRRGQRPAEVLRDLLLSPRLQRAYDSVDLSRVSLGLRLREAFPSPVSAEALEDRYVPQLLWPEQYALRLAPLLAGVDFDFGRRFSSMALLGYLNPRPWAEIADLLALPRKQAVTLAYACSTRLRKAGLETEFARQLAALVRWHAGGQPTDYAARRRVLAHLDRIDEETWRELCGEARVAVGKPVRREYAAIWLWCELTCGDYRLSPGMERQLSASAGGRNPLTRYRVFVRDDPFRQMRSVLLSYGESLVSDVAERLAA